jgi:toxic protein SymE
MTKRKEYRPMTVSECSDYGRNSFPMLRIKSFWLKQLGFEVGDPEMVKCEDNRLIITKVELGTEAAVAR